MTAELHPVDADPLLPDWPLYGWADDVRPAMAEAQAAKRPFALATLTATAGGAPRPVETQMLIDAERLSGFLSGGCVEADVAAHARAALKDGVSRKLTYGEGSPFPDIRLLCGARIDILVEPIGTGDAAVATLLEAWRARNPVTYVSDGVHRTASLNPAIIAPVTPGMFHVKRRYDPSTRMIVVGADPTALAIAQLCSSADMQTWLVRPKGPEEPPPLSGVRYLRAAAPEALRAIGVDAWTAVAVATHNLEVDEDALTAALPSAAFYVGVLGARRRLPERVERLKRLGVSGSALDRMRGPIGLDLGGKAPFEIAAAVLAEVIAARNGVAPAG